MIELKINVSEKMPEHFPLGRQGENCVRQIVFDVRPWLAKYGEGVVSLIAQRSGDAAPYPVAITVESGLAAWLVSNADTAMAGYGHAELRLTVGNAVKKSKIYTFDVQEALGPASAHPPQPYQGWVDEVLKAGAEAEQSAQSAAQSETNAAASAEQASETAQSVEEFVTRAEAAADNAEESAENAADSATQSATGADQAAGYASDASGSATAAANSAAQAAQSATQAAGSASDAAGSKADAAGSAASAQENADYVEEQMQSWNQKADQTTVDLTFKAISFDPTTGVFTFTRVNGTYVTVDTALEKVATNWVYDAQTQSLVLTLADGSTQTVPLSDFITEMEFVDSDTIDFSIENHTVTAAIRPGSITDSMLSSALVAALQQNVADAAGSAAAAASSAQSAYSAAERAASSQSAAAISAGNAATSETNAADSASAAAGSATAAAGSATNASTSAGQAATSATNAANSASAAATSESNAADSEQNAADSEQAAKDYADAIEAYMQISGAEADDLLQVDTVDASGVPTAWKLIGFAEAAQAICEYLPNGMEVAW